MEVVSKTVEYSNVAVDDKLLLQILRLLSDGGQKGISSRDLAATKTVFKGDYVYHQVCILRDMKLIEGRDISGKSLDSTEFIRDFWITRITSDGENYLRDRTKFWFRLKAGFLMAGGFGLIAWLLTYIRDLIL